MVETVFFTDSLDVEVAMPISCKQVERSIKIVASFIPNMIEML